MKNLHMLCLCLAAFFLYACSNDTDLHGTSLPQIALKTGSEEVQPSVRTRFVEVADYRNTELFQSIVTDSNGSIPYAELGETITITFKDKNPDSIRTDRLCP